jgi:hypothetical protein
MSGAPNEIAGGDSAAMGDTRVPHDGTPSCPRVSSLDLPGGSPPTAAGHLLEDADSPRAAADVAVGAVWPDASHRTIAEVDAAVLATRRPSLTVREKWRPKGPNTEPAFGIHVRLVFADAAGQRPHAVYLTPSRSAAKHGSELHARCEEIGMLVSWCLQRGMTLGEMEAQFKPVSPEGGQGLGLFAVATARAVGTYADAGTDSGEA